MAGQSMLMGDAFGKSYQYGKRKISAMSNEEFNKLTPADLAKDITADFTALIPELKIAMAKSTELQSMIIREMGEILKSIPEEIMRFFQGGDDTGPQVTNTISNVAYSGSVGIPLGPKAGSPEDQFGVVRDLGEQAIKKVLPKSPQQLAREKAARALAAEKAKPPAFGGGINPTQQFISDIANNTKGKFIIGATSKRRKTQSSNRTLLKLQGLVRNWIVYLQKYRNDRTRQGLGRTAYKRAVQRLYDWQFTYI